MAISFNSRNSPAVAIVWIFIASVGGFVMHMATSVCAELTRRLRRHDMKFLAAYLAYLCEIGRTFERVVFEVLGARIRCGIAFVRWAFAAGYFCHSTEIQAARRTPLQKIRPFNALTSRGDDRKRFGVGLAGLIAKHGFNNAGYPLRCIYFLLASMRSGNFLARFFGWNHAELRLNVNAQVVERQAQFLEFIKPFRFKIKRMGWGAIAQWNKLKCRFAMFVPRVLQLWIVVVALPQSVTMLSKSGAKRLRCTANIAAIRFNVKNHVDAWFMGVNFFHRWS